MRRNKRLLRSIYVLLFWNYLDNAVTLYELWTGASPLYEGDAPTLFEKKNEIQGVKR
jgi:hypothetical protein